LIANFALARNEHNLLAPYPEALLLQRRHRAPDAGTGLTEITDALNPSLSIAERSLSGVCFVSS
jgi:hypothetical protein